MIDDDTARELALFVPLEWSGEDAERLAPLVDATLVWAEDDVLERIATPIAAAMWDDGLGDDLESALVQKAEGSDFIRTSLQDARSDLARGPLRSKVGRAFVLQAAVELAFEEQMPVHCLLCVSDLLKARPPEEHRAVALRVGRIARRAAAVPDAELRAAVAAATFVAEHGDAAIALATDERRRAVRAWLARLAGLGETSMPALSRELAALAAEPLPPTAEDDLWQETVAGLVEALVEPWN